jgi:ATP-dependent RNA helicase DDX5/DBP2
MSTLSVFEKNFYHEHPAITTRDEDEVNRWRREHSIIISGRDVPKPVMSFEESPFPDYVLAEVCSCPRWCSVR